MTLAYFYTHSHKIAGNVHTSITIARGRLVPAGDRTLWEPVKGEPYVQITWCSVPHTEGEPAWLLPTYRLGDEATEPLVEASFQLVKHCICKRPAQPSDAVDLFPEAVRIEQHRGEGFEVQWYVTDFRGNERGK